MCVAAALYYQQLDAIECDEMKMDRIIPDPVHFLYEQLLLRFLISTHQLARVEDVIFHRALEICFRWT